jgi:hypothetical protein
VCPIRFLIGFFMHATRFCIWVAGDPRDRHSCGGPQKHRERRAGPYKALIMKLKLYLPSNTPPLPATDPDQIQHTPNATHTTYPSMPDITLITQNTQNTGRHIPSNRDIISLLITHKPEICFLAETPIAKDCAALCGILLNRGYNAHYHPSNTLLPADSTLPEARIPTSISNARGGCMLAYDKKYHGRQLFTPSHYRITSLPPGLRTGMHT